MAADAASLHHGSDIGGRLRRPAWLLAVLAAAACTAGPFPIDREPSATLAPSSATVTVHPTASAFAPETQPLACLSPEPQELERTYEGVAVAGEVPVLILLPPCYEETQEAYPVLYLLHGKPMTEQQWRDLGLAEILQQGWREARWPAFIAVAPRQPEPLFSNSDGGPGSYEEEFFEGLVPFIEASLAVDTLPSRRALGGISRGGVWALELALTHPEAIGTVAALSPALAVNYARPLYDPLHLALDSGPLPRLFLGAGEADWARPATERLSQLLLDREADVRTDLVEGGHEEATWLRLLPGALDFLTMPWLGPIAQAGGPTREIK
jgi:enterochelin esterase-like enzyme